MIVGRKSQDGCGLGQASVDMRKTSRLRTGKVLTSVILGVVLSSERPLVSYANPLLFTDANNISTGTSSSASAVGTPSRSATPYFYDSAGATRLLVDPLPSSSKGVSLETKKQFAKQIALQDSRLALCHERGIDWEQCFYYGTGAGSTPEGDRGASSSTLPNSNESDIPSSRNVPARGSYNQFGVGGSSIFNGMPLTTRAKIPTW